MNLDPRIERVNRPPVSPTGGGQRRRQHPDAPVPRLLDSGPSSRLNNPDNRHLERALRRPQRRRCRRIASDHDQLHIHPNKVVDDLERKPPHLRQIPDPVRHPRRVPKINGVLVRQPVLDLRQHRQPTNTRIENPDWPRITHGNGLYPFRTLRPAASARQRGAWRRLVGTLGLRPSLISTPPEGGLSANLATVCPLRTRITGTEERWAAQLAATDRDDRPKASPKRAKRARAGFAGPLQWRRRDSNPRPRVRRP